MKRSISEQLEKVAQIKVVKDRVNALRQLDSESPAYKHVLRIAFDPGLKWALPEGAPPYRPCEYLDQEAMLFNELRRMYIFFEGGNPNLKPGRREQMWVQLLESVPPADAKLLCAIKEKTLPWKGITKAIVKQAFPDLEV